MKFILFICILLLLNIWGCRSFFLPKPPKTHLASSLLNGQIVDKERLKSGGHLLIIPFSAGVQAEATDELDRVALMIVRGLADVLKEENAPLTILVAENADLADLKLSGYINKMQKPGQMKKWFLRKNKKILGVQGKMIDVKDGKIILYFSHQRETREEDKGFVDLGHLIGQDIGHFILSNI